MELSSKKFMLGLHGRKLKVFIVVVIVLILLGSTAIIAYTMSQVTDPNASKVNAEGTPLPTATSTPTFNPFIEITYTPRSDSPDSLNPNLKEVKNQPEPTATPVPAVTPTPVPTNTPSPTPTLVPTNTPMPIIVLPITPTP